MGKSIVPGFKSPAQVEAFLRTTCKPDSRFNGLKYQDVTALVESFYEFHAINPEKTKVAVAAYIRDAMISFLSGIEGTSSKPRSTGYGIFDEPKAVNRRENESTRELLARIDRLADYPISPQELMSLLAELGIKASRMEWKLSVAQLHELVNEHNRRTAERFRKDATSRHAKSSPINRMSILVAEKSKTDWDLHAAILGAYSLGSRRADVKGLIAQLVEWDTAGLLVDSNYLDGMSDAVSRQLVAIFKMQPAEILENLASAKYLRVGSLSVERQSLIMQDILSRPGFSERKPSLRVLDIQNRIESSLEAEVQASKRSTVSSQRCPICGQTPCARGSQCFNED